MSAEGDRNKIAQTLSSEELAAFIDRCWETPNLTLAKLQELAAEVGVSVSLMGAKSFRDTTYKRHIERIRRARELSEQLRELSKTGASLADAAGELLSHKVMDVLTADPEAEQPEELDMKSLSLVISRLRMGDARRDAIKLRQTDVAKAAIEKAAEIKSITSDTKLDGAAKLERVRQLLFGDYAEEAA